MQEIYRSRNMASLVVKKQFLEENDIPCRIYVQGMDITDMPSHPVYGMSYRFEQDATLMVDEEDEMSAWNLLHNIENPIEIEEEIDPEEDMLYRNQKKKRLIRGFFLLFYIAFSVIWLYYAEKFTVALWKPFDEAGRPADSSFMPLGIGMIAFWLISFVIILYNGLKKC